MARMDMAAMDTGERGTGRTTRQMKAAAKGALFISCNDHCARQYDPSLARNIGREDLVIRGPSVIERGCRQLAGKQWPEIVIDHWFMEYATPRQIEDMVYLTHWARPLRIPVTTIVPAAA